MEVNIRWWWFVFRVFAWTTLPWLAYIYIFSNLFTRHHFVTDVNKDGLALVVIASCFLASPLLATLSIRQAALFLDKPCVLSSAFADKARRITGFFGILTIAPPIAAMCLILMFPNGEEIPRRLVRVFMQISSLGFAGIVYSSFFIRCPLCEHATLSVMPHGSGTACVCRHCSAIFTTEPFRGT